MQSTLRWLMLGIIKLYLYLPCCITFHILLKNNRVILQRCCCHTKIHTTFFWVVSWGIPHFPACVGYSVPECTFIHMNSLKDEREYEMKLRAVGCRTNLVPLLEVFTESGTGNWVVYIYECFEYECFPERQLSKIHL